jgi:vitamin B12 transporter
MKQKLITVALFGAIALPFAAYAETPMELLIVTPTRMPQSLDKTIPDTTVLNEQDIQNSGAPDVPTLLRSLAGVEVVQSGGLGTVSSTFMRGTNSDHVLVLLDGVRINSATTGTTALEHIMLDRIERIEVVRGNVSSLYGSEAIGGVIQLFTKRGHGAPAFNASAGLGSHGTQRLAAGFSGSTDSDSYSVNVGRVKTDGVSAIKPEMVANIQPDKDGYENTSLSVNERHAFNLEHALSVSAFISRGESQYDELRYDPITYALISLPTDINISKEKLSKFSITSEDRLSESWHSKLQLAQGTDDNKNYLNGAENGRISTVNNQVTWQNELQLADKQRVNLAVEKLVQTVASDTLYNQTRRSVNSLLGGYLGEYGAQQVQFNLRDDRYSDFGTADTGLLGYGWSFADKWRATASISNAFKAPTFNDLYYPGYSNPNLRPERSQNQEAGLHYAAAGQSVNAIYFDNRIRDLIASNSSFTTVINVNQARIDGEELSYAGEFGDTRLKANATWQNPRNTTTGQELLRRAKQFANLAVTQHIGSWEAGGEWQYSGARQDADINTFAPVTLPSYQLFNLNARYQVEKNISVSARIDNLFNRDYMLVHGYNTLGRTLFVGLNYQQ